MSPGGATPGLAGVTVALQRAMVQHRANGVLGVGLIADSDKKSLIFPCQPHEAGI